MNKLAPEIINFIQQTYIAQDYSSYKQACQQSFELPISLQKIIDDAEYWLEPESPIIEDLWPSVRFQIVTPGYFNGLFQIEYSIHFEISKLYPCYQLSIHYEIENPDPEALGPSIWGYSEQPYTKGQMKFLERWEVQAQTLGWVRLSEREGNQLVSSLLEKPTAFPGESLWRHLSYDLLEFCPA